ncbi:uncharacterized protein LOC142550163 [Primulina tabacum]|uniref:uncharacterized protein LOC142550163 n=1 Tax=Primulina tabacum TaxID=48773 RepID=UPI003F5AC246
MELQDADRVRCATFLLTEEARLWWESVSMSVNLHTLSWDGFKEGFYSKYFTEEVRSRLTREFMTLRQGDCSMADFVRKFERGVAGPTTYVVAVSRALVAEQDQKDIENDRQGKRPYRHPISTILSSNSLRGPFRDSKERGHSKDLRKAKVLCRKTRLLRSLSTQCARSATVSTWASVYGALARRLMHKGYQAFLVNIISAPETPTSSIFDAPVVRYFPDVFSDDVIGLPPDREVEFAVDLMIGKTNIVADALSRKVAVVTQLSIQRSLQSEIQSFGLEVYPNSRAPKLSNLTVQSSMLDRIHIGQPSDERLHKWRLKDEVKGSVLYTVSDGIVRDEVEHLSSCI